MPAAGAVNALASVVAKVLALVDQVLEEFVTVASVEPTSSNCGINAIVYTIQPCGVSLIDGLATVIFALVKLGNDFLPALGAYNVTQWT